MLSYLETKRLIEAVLANPTNAVKTLNDLIKDKDLSIGQFYDGVLQHGPTLPFNSDEWFDFHSKIPHWRLRADKILMEKLTPNQREILSSVE